MDTKKRTKWVRRRKETDRRNGRKESRQPLTESKTAKVLSFSKEIKQKTQPKVFSLADIQLEASSKYGFSAQETLDTCQSLYETHKLASYPRSDCQYLPESQWEESKTVLTAIAKTLPKFLPLIRQCNLQIKSSVWNDKKYLHTTELFRPAKPEALKSSQTKNKNL